MATVAVIGAGSVVAPAALTELRRAGHRVLALGRERDRIDRTLAEVAEVTEVAETIEVREVPTAPDDAGHLDTHALVAALEDVDLAVHVGRAAGTLAVASAALDAEVPLVDAAGVHPHAARVADDLGATALATGIPIVLGAGAAHLVGDLLADVALGAAHAPTELHVAGVVPSPGGLVAALTGGGRHALAELLASPSEVVHGGQRITERAGEARRMAWYPRPIGPHHAVGIGGLETLMVPDRWPGLTTVRSYLAVPGWQAELVQFFGTVAGRPRGRRWIERRLGRRRTPGPAVRAATRWAVVAEAPGTTGVARAWANGHDPLRLTGVGAALVADQVLALPSPGGVTSPAAIAPATELLDALSARTDLRWAVIRPDRPG